MAILLDAELEGLPPTLNHYYRTSRSSIRYKTPEGKRWQALAVTAMRRGRRAAAPFEGSVRMTLIFSAKDRRRWDLDNRVKALQDCLAPAGIIRDDRQIDEIILRRCRGTKDRTRVRVRTLTAPGSGKVAGKKEEEP